MRLLQRLERTFGRFAIPQVTLIIIAIQVALYGFQWADPERVMDLSLIPRRVMEGEVWRVFLFLFQPPQTVPIFALFAWYMFFLMGTALERAWGTFRLNLYLLVGWAATVAVSFLTPDQPASNAFLYGSVFLAFAMFFPDFVIMLFFLLPVKIKWLALIAWIGYLWELLMGDWSARLLVLASIANFLLFFGRDVWRRGVIGHRRMVRQTAKIQTDAQPKAPRNVCRVCGANNLTHRAMQFRYCSQCEGTHCYCEEHLRDHPHLDKEGRPLDAATRADRP